MNAEETTIVVRRGGAQDVRFLRDMLHHAYYWKERAPDSGPGPVALYVKAWGRPGDTAVIAIEKGFPVGAAWYRLFGRDRPGYGFVDEQTPELAIAVVPNARGKGVGSALLDALLGRARAAGYPTISLSVDRANAGAIGLYERHGFRQVERRRLRHDARAARMTEPRAMLVLLGERGEDDCACCWPRRRSAPRQRSRRVTEVRYRHGTVDVAVLGGGPAGYTAAIRAAQLGGKVACIEQEPALGGTCLRVGCIPTKAWVQSAHAYHDAQETFAKLGVQVGEPTLDFGTVGSWKDAVVDQMTGGIASLFKANGVEWVKGKGTFTSPSTIAVEGAEEVAFTSAIVATGSFPMRPPIPGLDSPRCVDSTGLLSQTEVPGGWWSSAAASSAASSPRSSTASAPR